MFPVSSHLLWNVLTDIFLPPCWTNGPSDGLGLCGNTSWSLNSWFHFTRETSVCNVAKPKSPKPQNKRILFLTQKAFNQRQFWNLRCVVIWNWASSRTFRWCVWVFVSSLHITVTQQFKPPLASQSPHAALKIPFYGTCLILLWCLLWTVFGVVFFSCSLETMTTTVRCNCELTQSQFSKMQ